VEERGKKKKNKTSKISHLSAPLQEGKEEGLTHWMTTEINPGQILTKLFTVRGGEGEREENKTGSIRSRLPSYCPHFGSSGDRVRGGLKLVFILDVQGEGGKDSIQRNFARCGYIVHVEKKIL